MGCASSKPEGDFQRMRNNDANGAVTPRECGRHAHALQQARNHMHTVDKFADAVRDRGVGSLRLIVAIDLTKGNKTQGAQCFHGQSLHALDPETNPYKMVLEALASSLLPLDPTQRLQVFGFGDFVSQDMGLIHFSPEAGAFRSTADAISGYNEVLRQAHLSGPINWAPAINQAIQTVQASGGRLHVLAILTCGSVDEMHEKATLDAIVAASFCALHIVVVGLGDGPWHQVTSLQARLPGRPMDNFRFVRYETIFLRARRLKFDADRTAADFAVAALMDVPDIFEAAGKLGYLGSSKQREVRRVKVYSPFDAGTSGSIRPLPPKQVLGKGGNAAEKLVDASTHSANPLFDEP